MKIKSNTKARRNCHMMLKSLWDNFRLQVSMVVFGHILAAILGLLEIALVHRALFVNDNTGDSNWLHWIDKYDTYVYLGVLPLLFIVSIASYRQLARLGAKVLCHMRENLVAGIFSMPYQQQEAIGGSRIRTLLTLDLDKIGEAFRALPMLAFNLALLCCCLVYMFWLSALYFYFYVMVLVMAGLSAKWLLSHSSHLLSEHREVEGNLHEHFSAVVTGAKELTLNYPRRVQFQNTVSCAAKKAQTVIVASENLISIMVNWVTLLIFVILGALLFLSDSSWAESQDVLAGYVIMTLFIRGPVLSISSNLPILTRGNIAWQQIQSAGIMNELTAKPMNVLPTESSVSTFESLELDNVIYNYTPEVADEDGFALGPINLKVKKGELLFIVGGNGSGKSTLAKLLSGLYAPTSGTVLVNDQPITQLETLNSFISSVFFDFHLFNQVLDEKGQAVSDEEVTQWLKRLEMDKKVSSHLGVLSSTNLSQGQKKRLALIVACCENRPVLLFDEWAADQDPHFRKVFYEELLPWLISKNKTVIAITHDDRYFSIADRVCKLEFGKLSNLEYN